MKLYGGIDLHSTNNYLVLIDESGCIQYKKRLANDAKVILHELKQFECIESLVVESTYNWYWLVDALQESGYSIKLANPNAIQQYKGLKHTDDKTDARWLAELNRLTILPTGYIYPKEQRGLRDLLRKRMQLVQQNTQNLLGIQTIIERNTSLRFSGAKIKKFTDESLKELLSCPDVYHAASSNLAVMTCLTKQIESIEKIILPKIKINPAFVKLKTISGVGEILAQTILLETGDINRFKSAGNYASYCRCVGSIRISNGKKKGENNRKNGNKYLCWAFIEAAHFAIRHNDMIKSYYQRKKSKTHPIVAIKTVAHKIARASYYIMRDQVDFNAEALFMN